MGTVKSVRIALNPKGIVAMLKSQEVADDLTRRGEAIGAAAGQAGATFDVRTTENRDRAVVFVTASTIDAKLAEAEDRALTRAIDAGR